MQTIEVIEAEDIGDVEVRFTKSETQFVVTYSILCTVCFYDNQSLFDFWLFFLYSNTVLLTLLNMLFSQGEASGPRVDATAAAQWMRKCLVLASSWVVSSDALRRHQICDLYMTGFDRLAEEVGGLMLILGVETEGPLSADHCRGE